jgi:hypothetical protein
VLGAQQFDLLLFGTYEYDCDQTCRRADRSKSLPVHLIAHAREELVDRLDIDRWLWKQTMGWDVVDDIVTCICEHSSEKRTREWR